MRKLLILPRSWGETHDLFLFGFQLKAPKIENIKNYFFQLFMISFLTVSCSPIESLESHAPSKIKQRTIIEYRELVTELKFAETIDRRAIDAEARVRNFLIAESSKYGWTPETSNLKLIGTRFSLLGVRYDFQQYVGDFKVFGSKISVTLKKNDEIVISNTLISVKSQNFESIKKETTLSIDEAYDIAWKDMRGNGNLLEPPSVELGLFYDGSRLKKVFNVMLAVSIPFGYWAYMLDVKTGEILLKTNRLHGKKSENSRINDAHPIGDRKRAFASYIKNIPSQKRKRTKEARNWHSGSALVFDPDPITSLRNESLTDVSSDIDFEEAYVKRELKNLSILNGVYHLSGPWIYISDFHKPVSIPSTSTTGAWSSKRGDNSFNDVMTYYHIDKNQRYLQSLGYINESGVVFRSIEVDSNGMEGKDNSRHIPDQDGRSGQLSFGHGCIDDNEDADVIIHEYAHAIRADIAGTTWDGGDTRAISEGFSDYWAASYGLSTTNGNTYKPDRIFDWDAATKYLDSSGNNVRCWKGRSVSIKGYKYSRERDYGAHEPLDPKNPNSPVSEELWSTPLFNSLRIAISLGERREDIDTIVVESMFAANGASLKMTDLATSIIVTADQLYPNKLYSEIFRSQFIEFGILD